MPMVWIAVGDIHNDSTKLHTIPELETAEGIIITGDITLGEGKKKAQKTLEPFIDTGKHLLILPGNMDTPLLDGWLQEYGWNIHRCVKNIATTLPCLGLGFSPTTPFNTPGEFPEEQFTLWLEECVDAFPSLTDTPEWLFISHTPPYNTVCDKLHNGTSVGSPSIRAFIERYQPTYCLCGHIHEAAGYDLIGKTTVINPGPLSDGGYVVLSIHEGTPPTVRAEYKKL